MNTNTITPQSTVSTGAPQTERVLAIVNVVRGKWSYSALVTYKAGTRKDGSACWLKDEELGIEATKGSKKIERLAKEKAAALGIPLRVNTRHFDARC